MNYKIRVENEAESKETQGFFEQLGFKKSVWGTYKDYFIFANRNYYSRDDIGNFSECDYKEITLPELRDLVVLKRNDVEDKTHKCDTTNGDYFVTSDNTVYFFDDEKTNAWKKSNYDLSDLKPIEKPMKEYLNKDTYEYKEAVDMGGHSKWIEIPEGAECAIESISPVYFLKWNGSTYDEFFNGEWKSGAMEKIGGRNVVWQRNQEKEQAEFLVKTDSSYSLQVLDENSGGADVVRVPEGAEIAILASGVVYFWKSHFFNGGVHKDWVDMKEGWDASWYLKSVPSAITIWQRETLNDQVASAETARQSEKVLKEILEGDLPEFDFGEIDAFIESNVEQGQKHSHYKKDVSHLNVIDIYRVTEMFKPHSCGAHIAKKALCSGKRGHKDLLTDIQDIIDTAERWKEMLIEDEKSSVTIEW